MRLLSLFAALLMALAPLRAQEPVFHDGDPSKLKVKVTKASDSLDGEPSALLIIEVRNPTEYWVEPLSFEIAIKRRSERRTVIIPRVHAPFYGRAGRAVPPGGKLSYPLNVPEAAKYITKSKTKVVTASFFSGEPLEDPPILVGDLEKAITEVDEAGERTKYSHIQLENTTDFLVEAILEADFSAPNHGTTLVHILLEPQERGRFRIEGPYLGISPYPARMGSDLKKVELVDWSMRPIPTPDPGEALLREAFEKRMAWPIEEFKFTASYQLEIEQYDTRERERVKVQDSGQCISEGQFPRFLTDQGVDEMLSSMGSVALGFAHQNLATPTYEEWLDEGVVRLHTQDGDLSVIGVMHTGEKKGLTKFYWVNQGDIVRVASFPFSGASVVFEYERLGDRFVVTKRTNEDLKAGPGETDHFYLFHYELVDGFAIPTEVHHEKRFSTSEQNIVVHVQLSDVKVEPIPEEDLDDEKAEETEEADSE